MEKIYSKIVRERKEEFQIETSIQQDCKKKYVVKRPLCPAGVTHIRRMEETYIKEKKNNTLLCPCFIEGDSVYFEYVNGITLCQKMLRSVETGNEIELQRLIKEYEILIEKLCCGKEKTNVQFEGEFSEVFGNLGNEEQRRISENSYSDLVFDLTFDNIIYNEDFAKIIDYEWRFSFPVPVDFIKFRAVYAFLMKYDETVRKMYTYEEFYKLFNIKKENISVYLSMNEAFIRYVYGEQGYNELLNRYKKENYNIFLLETMKEKESKLYKMILSLIEEHRSLYDDYKKFFRVSDQVKQERGNGYLFSDEFSEEFYNFLSSNLDMIEFYKKQWEETERIKDEIYKIKEEKEQIINELAENYFIRKKIYKIYNR